MGMVVIKLQGSFPDAPKSITFSATEGGHANALARAIAYLTDELPDAIKKDHTLQAQGTPPPGGWFGSFKIG